MVVANAETIGFDPRQFRDVIGDAAFGKAAKALMKRIKVVEYGRLGHCHALRFKAAVFSNNCADRRPRVVFLGLDAGQPYRLAQTLDRRRNMRAELGTAAANLQVLEGLLLRRTCYRGQAIITSGSTDHGRLPAILPQTGRCS